MVTIINEQGKSIDFATAVNMMDDDIREEICSRHIFGQQRFFCEYCAAHRAKFGEEFEPNKANPVW